MPIQTLGSYVLQKSLEISAPLKWIASFFIGFVLFFFFLAQSQAAVFAPKSFELKNGMQVLLLENDRVPVVTHMVWYKVGAADEPPGKSGIAHFLEHLMFKGTDDIAAGEFSKIVARNGGRDNAFTSWDYTAYHQTIAADRLALVMKMEADRMTDLQLSDPVVLPERDVILEERNARIDTDPSAQLGEAMRAALYQNHPYGIPIIGWRHEMETLSTDDAMAFYRNWYRPENAILIVAGDVSWDVFKPLAEKYYGQIPNPPKSSTAQRARPQEPAPLVARALAFASDQVKSPTWRRHYLAPTLTSQGKEHALALQVLTTLFCEGATSRLYRALQVEQKTTSAVGCYYNPDSRDKTAFSFYAVPSPNLGQDPEKALDAVESALETQIALLKEKGPTEEEVNRAKKRLKAEAIYARDDLATGARILGTVLASGGSLESVETWPEAIGQVTQTQVHDAALAIFKEEASVTGRLLPKPKTP